MSVAVAEHFPAEGLRLALHQGDLTTEPLDAIVNAANSRLAHGGGVAGAIVRRGGIEIQHESDAIVRDRGGLATGEAAWTGAGTLPCGGVIHAVGPRWGEGDERRKLASAAASSFALATRMRCRAIALPAISSGIFGFPKDECAEVLVQSALDFFASGGGATLVEIRFTIIDDETVGVFKEEFAGRFGPSALVG